MNKNNLIGPLLIASCAIHGLFFYSFHYEFSTPVIEMGDIQIAVTIESQAYKHAEKQKTEEKVKIAAKNNTETEKTIANLNARLVKNSRIKNHEPIPAAVEIKQFTKPNPAQLAKQQNIYRAYVKSRVNNQFKQYFYYPKIAARRGWQGHVLLGFNVSASGEIYNITIAKSSGYSVLDNAALDSLNQVKYISHENQRQGMEIDVKLPVIYKLIGGYHG